MPLTRKILQKHMAYSLFITIVGTYLFLALFFPVAYIWAVYEDLVGEWAQWYCFIIAFFFSIRNSMSSHRYRPFFIFLSIATFYVVMEEISWGQRMLNYSSPDFFRQHNLQNEANLHNFIVGPYDTILRSIIEYSLALCLFIYGLVYPLLIIKQSRLAIFTHRWIPAPPLYLWPFFVMAAVLELSPFYMLEQELAELLVGSALALMSMSYYYSLREEKQTSQQELIWRTSMITIGVLSLSLLTTSIVHSIPHMKVQTDKRIQYGYSKFASRYQRYEAWGLIAQLNERLLEKKPRDVNLIRDTASLYKRSGNKQQMVKLVNKALAIDLPRFQRYPEWISVNLSLAKTYELTGNTTKINRHLDNALIGAKKKIKKSPDNANNAYWLGKTYAQRKEAELATLQFKRAFELKPESSKYREAYYRSRDIISKK